MSCDKWIQRCCIQQKFSIRSSLSILDFKQQSSDFLRSTQKFRNLPHALYIYLLNVQTKIFSNFVRFSESPNFNLCNCSTLWNQALMKLWNYKIQNQFSSLWCIHMTRKKLAVAFSLEKSEIKWKRTRVKVKPEVQALGSANIREIMAESAPDKI